FDGMPHTGEETTRSVDISVMFARTRSASLPPYTTLFRSGIYTAYAAAKIDATSCESATRTTVTVTINALPGAPSAGNVIACFDGVAHSGSEIGRASCRERGYDCASGGSVTTAPTGSAVGIYTAYA